MNKRITQAPKLGIRLTAKFTAVAAAAAVAAVMLDCPARAAVKTLVGSTGASSFPGGTWDFGVSENWTEDNYQTFGTWTSNDDIAVISLYTNSNNNLNIVVSDVNEAVGAAGIVITNDLKSGNHVIFNGAPLTIGSAGITAYSIVNNSHVTFNTPIVLAAGQTWRSGKNRELSNLGSFFINGVISSAAGQSTPIIFDGFGVTDPSLYGNSVYRSGVRLNAENTFSGSTTVSGGAMLSLAFSVAAPNQKIDSASPLILNGGTLLMTGNSATYTQSVASVIIKAGANHIGAFNASGAFICNAIKRDGVGGTLNSTLSWSGGATFYTSNTNETSILGGWFTCVNQSFAVTGASGGIGALTSSQRWSTDAWGNNENIRISGGGVRTLGDVSPYSLRCDGLITNDFGTATVTVKSGGILVPNTIADGGCFTGGQLRTGMDTGELFIHAYRPLVIASTIEDNGATPCILVKSGDRELTLAGTNTYTGDTYLNGGTLALEGSASMSAPCHQAGGTLLSISKGARLAPLSGGYTLGGNLLLGAGAVVELQADSTNAQGEAAPPVTLENPWGAFTVSATENAPASLAISFSDTNTLRPGDTFRLIEWQPTTALSGVSPDAFALTLPRYMEGELVVAPTGLDFVVTQTPGIATFIIVK